MNLRAIFATASFGNGHHATCDAVEAALSARVALKSARIDILDAMTPAERTVIGGMHRFWNDRHPKGYERFYRFTDHPATPERLLRVFGQLGKAAVRQELMRQRPNLVLHTFPSSAATAHQLRREFNLRFCNVLVLTDQRVHRHWARNEADLILLPNLEAKAEMLRWGLPSHKLRVCGMPLRPEIAMRAEQSAAERKAFLLGLGFEDSSLKTLVIAPRARDGECERVLQELERLNMPLNVIVGQPSQSATSPHLQVRTLTSERDFVGALAAADLFIGKAGGVTTAECAVLGLPMVIYRPLPAQEEHNARYFVARGAALWPQTPAALRRAVASALAADNHGKMRAAALALGHKNAAGEAADAILRLMQEQPWRWQGTSK